jgi:phosphatidylethanolamine/phosphatidyl-N-methylethanolamine N-methyltransferase
VAEGFREHILVLTKFLRSPRTVGLITPSSRVLAHAMIGSLPVNQPASIVELGPGTGAFTGAILDRVGPKARVLAVDLEPEFIEKVRRAWPSVRAVCGSAENLEALVAEHGLGQVDHIISGLPFASLPTAMTNRILDGVMHTLRQGGTFTQFQYLHGFGMPPGRAFRREMSARMGGAPARRFVLRNIPPACVFTWRRH